jgi:uncharacterized membrane protein
MSGAFIGMGVLHFAVPKPFIATMPRVIPKRWWRPLVLISGACEILGGVGALLPATRPWAGAGLLLLLVAVFPANIQMLLNARRRGEKAVAIAALWIRLPLQAALLWWVWAATLAAPAA